MAESVISALIADRGYAFVFGELDQDDFIAHVSGYKPRRVGFKGNYVAHYLFSTHRERYRKCWPKSMNNLSKLVTKFPPELLLLILEHLHPIDLYHLVQTTWHFRNLLLSKGSSPIWKNSFLAHPDILRYPDDVSPPKWVSLLFGPATCDKCGTAYTLVDFAYRERRCIPCRSFEFFYPSAVHMLSPIDGIIQRYPVIEDVIWRLLRKTFKTKSAYMYPTFGDYETNTPKYSTKDVVEMAQKLYALMEASGEHSRRAFQQFVREKEALADDYMKCVMRCERWSDMIYLRCNSRYQESVARALDVAQKKYIRRGYDKSDIIRVRESIEDSSLFKWSDRTAYKLSRTDTKNLCIEFDRRVQLQQIMRQKEQGRNAWNARAYVASVKYKQIASKYFKLSSFVPNNRLMFKLPLIREFVADEAYKYVHERNTDNFPDDTTQEQIIQFISDTIADRKRTLAKLVHSAGFVSPQQLDNPTAVLNLATALFEKSCISKDQIFIGWDDAGKDKSWCDELMAPHLTYYPPIGVHLFVPPHHLTYSKVGRQALQVIAGLLSLDLSSAQIEDLDSMNRRFFCKTCGLYRNGSVYGLDAMNWRECLQHTFLSQNFSELAQCSHPSFDVASDELTKSILFLEKPWPFDWEDAWFCLHCTDFPRIRCKRSEVVTHVRKVHDVRKPVRGTDFLYEPRPHEETDREMFFVGLAENSNYRCLRCPAETKSLRLWQHENVRQHLVDAHKVQRDEQKKGIDLKKVNAVADEAWTREAYDCV